MQARLRQSGGALLVEALRTHGTRHLFCVPGESFLAVLDALHDCPEIAVTVCRQEGGAAMMADAHGKLTGEPGVCFVTRGPGATNASAGVHVAFQDSTPLILLIGQIARSDEEREAFQEVDYRRMFGPLAKWVAQVNDAARIPEFLARAFRTATSGRPGPVVLAFPEDVLSDLAESRPVERYQAVQAHPDPERLRELAHSLAAAERPLVVVGGGGWSAAASADLARFAAAWDLPVAASFRCQDYLDNDHPNYCGDLSLGGNPALFRRLEEADLILAVGPRLGDVTTNGYTAMVPPVPRQKLLHIHTDAEEIGRVYQPAVGINAGSAAALAALAGLPAPAEVRWHGQRQEARKFYEGWNAPAANPGPVQMADVVGWLRAQLPEDAIVTNGAGNYAAFVQRYFRFRQYRTLLAPTSGSMGYGVPAAVAAKRIHPDRTVVAFAGDGCFQMHGQEFGTAAQYGLPIIVIVVNNGMYGTIRMHQERHYPGRVSATGIVNPDFARLAEAYGGFGIRVERTEEFASAFAAAKASGRPALIEIRLDPEAITTRQSLSDIRRAAERAQPAL